MSRKSTPPILPIRQTKPWSRWAYLMALLSIMAVSGLVFSNTLKADFIYNWDDNINVTTNPHIRDLSWTGISKLFDPETRIDEPRLTLLTYAVEYRFFSLNAKPYHLNNVLLHVINVLLVFVFVRRFFKSKSLPLLIALLFGIHPLHVEPVAWITGRKDLLFSIFYLLSLITYDKSIRSKSHFVWLLLALGLAFLGLLSKIQAMSLPLAWVMLDVYAKRKFTPALVAEKLMLVFILLYNHISAVQLGVLFSVFSFVYFYPKFRAKSWLKRVWQVYARRAKRAAYFIWIPLMALLVFIGLRKLNLIGFNKIDARIWILTVGGTCMIIFNYLYFVIRDHSPGRKKVIIWISVISGLAILLLIPLVYRYGLPDLNLWTSDFKRDFSVMDRLSMAAYAVFYYFLRFFFPFNTSPIQPYPESVPHLPFHYYLALGALVLVIVTMVVLIRKKKIRLSPPVYLGISFFLINIVMVLHLISIEGRVVVADRYAYLALAGLLIAAAGVGESWLVRVQKKPLRVATGLMAVLIITFAGYSYQRNRIWNNGIALFNEVIEHHPDYELAYINRGTLFLNAQKNKQAVDDFTRAIEIDPGRDIAYYNRAQAWYNLNEPLKAFDDCNRTIANNPLFYDAHYMRAFLKNKMGNYAGAIADYNQVLRMRPDHKLAYYNRGNSRKNLWDFEGALKDYQQTLTLDTGFVMAYNAAGVALFFMGRYQESLVYYNDAIRKNPGEGNYFFNRGLSELKLNLTDEACRDLEASWGLGYSDSKDLLDKHCR